jgi:hypothetical protein
MTVSQAGADEIPDRVLDAISLSEAIWILGELAKELVGRSLSRMREQQCTQGGGGVTIVIVHSSQPSEESAGAQPYSKRAKSSNSAGTASVAR